MPVHRQTPRVGSTHYTSNRARQTSAVCWVGIETRVTEVSGSALPECGLSRALSKLVNQATSKRNGLCHTAGRTFDEWCQRIAMRDSVRFPPTEFVRAFGRCSPPRIVDPFPSLLDFGVYRKARLALAYSAAGADIPAAVSSASLEP